MAGGPVKYASIHSPQAATVVSDATFDHVMTDGAGNLCVTGPLVGGAVAVGDGDDAAEGTTTDAGVVTDAAGTLSAKLRGLIIILLRAFAIGTPIRTDPTNATKTSVQAAAGDLPAHATEVSGAIWTTASLTVKRAFSNVAAATTDGNVVTAVADKKIRVLSVYAIAGATATNLTFNSKGGGAGTAISALFANGVNGGEILPHNPHGWFETASGEALTVTTGAGSTTGLGVNYVEAA